MTTAQAEQNAPVVLSDDQRAVLTQVFSDALERRNPPCDCADCAVHPAALCDPCGDDLDMADQYVAIARTLGIEVEE